jgi:hypothetical protein
MLSDRRTFLFWIAVVELRMQVKNCYRIAVAFELNKVEISKGRGSISGSRIDSAECLRFWFEWSWQYRFRVHAQHALPSFVAMVRRHGWQLPAHTLQVASHFPSKFLCRDISEEWLLVSKFSQVLRMLNAAALSLQHFSCKIWRLLIVLVRVNLNLMYYTLFLKGHYIYHNRISLLR